MSQDYALAAEMASIILGDVHWGTVRTSRRGTILCSALMRAHLATLTKFRAHAQERGTALKLAEVWSICPLRTGLGTRACSAWRRNGLGGTNSSRWHL